MRRQADNSEDRKHRTGIWKGFAQAATRLAFVALFTLPAGYCSYQVSPLKLGTISATVHDAKVWQGARSAYGFSPDSDYQIIFTTKEYPCAFRYPFYFYFHEYLSGNVEAGLADGDRIDIVYSRASLAPASRAAGIDCLSGERLPGRSPYAVPSRSMLPDLVEAMDVWKGRWTVARWLPQRYQWIAISGLGFIIGLIILAAPLIDRITGQGRWQAKRRFGVKRRGRG